MKLAVIIALTATATAKVTKGCATSFAGITSETAGVGCSCDKSCSRCIGSTMAKMDANKCANNSCNDGYGTFTKVGADANVGTCTAGSTGSTGTGGTGTPATSTAKVSNGLTKKLVEILIK